MTFSERMKDFLEQGWAATKEAAAIAGEKAQDLGERGMLMWDIKQLENQAEKHLARLGNEVYIMFTEREQNVLDVSNDDLRKIMDDISNIKNAIERKEAELKLKKAL